MITNAGVTAREILDGSTSDPLGPERESRGSIPAERLIRTGPDDPAVRLRKLAGILDDLNHVAGDDRLSDAGRAHLVELGLTDAAEQIRGIADVL